MASSGLLQTALFIVCLLVVSKADDLMMEEMLSDAVKPVGDLTTAKNVDLVFLIHTSTKVKRPTYDYYKEFMRDVVQGAKIDNGNVRVGIAVYRKRALVAFNLKKHKTQANLLAAINNLRLYRSKQGSVADGLDTVRTKILTQQGGERDNAPNIVIILTDSNSNVDVEKIRSSAQALRDAGTKIYAVSVGIRDTSQMQTIVSSPRDIYTLDTFVELATVRDDVIKQVPALKQRDGPEETTASVEDVNSADLAIVYHLSNKMSPQDIDQYFVPFLLSIVEKAKITEGKVRVALVNYAKRARTAFNLSKYTTNEQIIQQLKAIDRRDRAKKSDGAAALNEVRTTIFSQRGGDRLKVPNAIVLFTDAKTSDNAERFVLEAQALKDEGVKIVTVGTAAANAAELRDVASEPANENALFARSYENLDTPAMIEPIRSAVRALSDAPAPVQPTRPVAPTEVARPTLDLREANRVDVVFAIHFDPRRSREDFDALIAYIQSLIATSDVDGGNVQFGFYIDQRVIPFYLSQYSTNEETADAVGRIAKNNARAPRFDLAGTLREIGGRMFTPRARDRPDVPNALILITDTSSGQRREEIEREVTRATEAGIGIYTLGIGLSDKGEMESVASSPRNVFAFADYDDLRRNGGALRQQLGALNTRQAPSPTEQTTPAIRITLPPPRSDCALGRADLIIVIDSSTSVTEANFRKVLNFLKDFLSKADIDSGNVRVGVVLYSSDVYQIFQLNTYSNMRDILRAVDNIEYRYGSTNTAGALDIMRNVMFTPVNGDRADIPNVAIVLTDGVSNVNAQRTIYNARLAHDDGIHIYTIGVGLTDTRELDGIASPPARDNSFKVADFDELQNVDDLIFASACPKEFTMPPPTRPRPTTTTTERTTTTTERTTTTRRPPPTRPPRTTTTRATTTTTTTTPRPTTTTTRRTTTPRRIPKYSETGTDIIFMLDSSVDNRIFGWMKSFVRDFARQLDVDSGEWRVAGMTFDDRSRAEFQLNRYNFQDEVINGLDSMRNRRSSRRPDVAGAFDYARRSMFTYSNGDRPRARNYVVLLTGNEKSLNADRSYAAANRLKDLGTGVYTIGLNFRDSTEIDEISSKPVDEFRTLIYSEDELGEVPGIYKYRMDRAPPPTTRPPPTTTTTTRRPTEPIRPYTGDCKAKGDVIFVLDTSGSVGEYNYGLMKNFTYATVRDLEIDNGFFRVGVITYSDSSRIQFQLNRYTTKQEIYDALQAMPYVYGYTHTAEALRRVRTEMFTTRNGDRLDVPNLLVIVTDGHSNVNHLETLPEARQIKSSGTTIVTVAIGLEDNTELRGLTSQPLEKNLIEVTDFEALHRLSQVIVEPLCTDVNMCDRSPCQNEGVCVDGLRSYMCICTSGFYGDNCERSCGPAADVVLILDSSTSVGSVNFAAIKSYAQAMVSEMNVLTCGINIGVMKYSSAPMIQFQLGYYDTEDEILTAIDAISYTPGRSNMAEALRVVRTQMFNNRNGDRYNARNIAYLLSDGTVEINRDITSSEVELTVDAGVRIVPLAVDVRDRTELEYIAETQGIPLMEIESEENLKEMMNDQVLRAVHDPDNHCSPNPCSNGARCVNEPLGFSCECPEGFAGELCDRACNTDADVVFAVDASRYNSGPEFRAVKRFLRDVIKRMAFRGGSFRVGVVEYGAAPRMRLSLLEGDNKRTVKSVVGGLRRQSGDPDLASAIQLIDYNMFGEAGDRPNVPNYLVVVSRSVGGMPTIEAINNLKAKGTKVIGVGVDMNGSDRKYLEAAVSSPVDQTLFMVGDAQGLDRISVDFVNFVCEEKNLCIGNPCQNGGTCENGEKSFVCRCPPGYAGQDCSKRCQDKADIVFLIDSSGSVGFESFRRIKEYVHHVIDSLNIGSDATQVGVATFSQSSRREIYLNQYDDKRKLQAAVSGITYEYGNTNTASGIKLVRSSLFSETRGNRPDAADFMVIITDGLSNINHEATLPEAELARKQGIHIFSIGVGVSDPWELNGIASEPTDRNVFRVDSWDGLWGIADDLVSKSCRDEGVCAENPCRNGGTCVAGVGMFTCECQQGYVGEFCEMGCQTNKDIAIILDASASVGPGNFELMITYVAAIVRDLTEYGQDHRFAFITYATEVRPVFSFNRYNTQEQILAAILTTPYAAGSTNTAGGLRQAHTMFQREYGDRPTADNIAILITDGQSNVNYLDTIPAANTLKADNVKVIAIGINLQDTREIDQIGSSPKDIFKVTSFDSLEEIEQDIIQGSCEEVE